MAHHGLDPADAVLIDFAGRTVALAQRHEEVESQRNDAQGEIDKWDFANKPETPELPEPRSRMVATDLSTATHRIMQFAEPIEDGDAQVEDALLAYKEARKAHKQAVSAKLAASSVPSLAKLSDSLWQQVVHTVKRLADMEPSTLAGIAAKAAVIEVLAETDDELADHWGQSLLRSIAEDTIRLHASLVIA